MDVYMTRQRHARRNEMTPVSCDGSMFVYVIPPQTIMRARVHPGSPRFDEISLRIDWNEWLL